MGKKINIIFLVETHKQDKTLTEEVNKFIDRWFAIMEGIEVKDIKLSFEKYPPDPLSRADRISNASSDIENGLSEASSVQEELESWRDNLPEQFQEKIDELDEVIDQIEEAVSDAQEAVDRLNDVEIPGAFGR